MKSFSVEQVLWRALVDPVFRDELLANRRRAVKDLSLSGNELDEVDRIDVNVLESLAREVEETTRFQPDPWRYAPAPA
ncbi:MAG: hypothetical protein COS65_05115 [Armatimonadetes bacterium CG06_land_8_20_14_3_00_66_21]|nr:MAG: hypothetical protein COS65_05115 [Armatimonadetes bacterium CG06_land_8_20_14_3_00_66_21]